MPPFHGKEPLSSSVSHIFVLARFTVSFWDQKPPPSHRHPQFSCLPVSWWCIFWTKMTLVMLVKIQTAAEPCPEQCSPPQNESGFLILVFCGYPGLLFSCNVWSVSMVSVSVVCLLFHCCCFIPPHQCSMKVQEFVVLNHCLESHWNLNGLHTNSPHLFHLLNCRWMGMILLCTFMPSWLGYRRPNTHHHVVG